jgi:hypothetical protein
MPVARLFSREPPMGWIARSVQRAVSVSYQADIFRVRRYFFGAMIMTPRKLRSMRRN